MCSRHAIDPICGGCGATGLILSEKADTTYGLCPDCERLQEVELRADPCAQLCDNCAFRPDSPERTDPWGWMRMQEKHIEGGVPFYCHKGLPLEFNLKGSTHVIDTDATRLEAKEKPCAGWLAHRLAHCHREVQRNGG